MMNEDVRAEKHIEEKENETQDIIKRARISDWIKIGNKKWQKKTLRENDRKRDSDPTSFYRELMIDLFST